MAGAPKIRIMPIATEPATCHDIRPVMNAIPQRATAIMPISLAHVVVRRFCKAVKKLVPESNKAVCA